MNKYQMSFDRDCRTYVDAVAAVMVYEGEYSEFTFPEMDTNYINVQVDVDYDRENAIKIDIDYGVLGVFDKEFKYQEDAIKWLGYWMVETMDKWGWFNC